MTPARFRWGMLLIQVGIFILLRNWGILHHGFFWDLLVWSPVVLIAVGIEKIFAKSKAQVISYMTTIALFAGGFVIVMTSGSRMDGGDFFTESTIRRQFDESIKKITAIIDLKNTDLTIRDSGDDLLFGRFAEMTDKPKVDYTIRDGELLVEMENGGNWFFGDVVHIDLDEPQDWYLKFSEEVPLDMTCYGNNSDIHLNLSTTPVQNLRLEADDAHIYLKLGDLESAVNVVIEGLDSDLRLRVPSNIGLKIVGGEYDSYLKRLGFVPLNGGFVNGGWDTLDSKIEIDVDDGLSSFSVDYF